MVDAPLATQALQFLIDDTIETEFHDQGYPQGLAFVSCRETFYLSANLGTAGPDIGAITVVDFRPKCSATSYGAETGAADEAKPDGNIPWSCCAAFLWDHCADIDELCLLPT